MFTYRGRVFGVNELPREALPTIGQIQAFMERKEALTRELVGLQNAIDAGNEQVKTVLEAAIKKIVDEQEAQKGTPAAGGEDKPSPGAKPKGVPVKKPAKAA